MTVGIVALGLADLANYYEKLPEATVEAAFLAINDSARDAVPAISRRMLTQVAFPRGYLDKDKLGVRRKATRNSLEATISGRDRPTSLARFARGATVANSRAQPGQAARPLFVQVKPGSTIKLKKAFLVNLKNGNTGLAVRLKPGERLQNSEKAVRLDNNVYLLYGPSVDQVMRGVAEEETPYIIENISKKFLRQFGRVTARG